MRVAAVGLIILMAVGCGGGSSDSAKIDAAIRTFETGIASGDGQKACAVMSGAYIRDMLSQVSEPDCTSAVNQVGQQIGPDERARIGDLVKHMKLSISVDGSSANVQLIGMGGGTFGLVKVDGKWYIASTSTTN